MVEFHYTLPPESLAQAFPFHFVLDSSLRILQVGDVLQRLLAQSVMGDTAEEHFVISRPKISWDLDKILTKQKSLFLLSAKDSALNLKGQMMWVEAENVLFFLGSAWGYKPGDLKGLGLKLQDFALHDATTDFVILQRTSQMSLEDAQALTQQVQIKKEQVEKLLQHQEKLTHEAHERAQALEKTLNDLRQTQLHLVQAEKMSALGQLVAGIAHEINNPLAFVSGNLDCLKTDVANLLRFMVLYKAQGQHLSSELETAFSELEFDFLETDLPKLLRSLTTGSDRITEIVDALRNFSRLDESPIKQVNIHAGLDSSLRLLQHRLKGGSDRSPIEIKRHYSSSFPSIECFAGQLNQVFMNIMANAIDALESGSNQTPTITITTSQLSSDWVRIAIADNGPGIPLAIQAKIFDPFFTTKPIGKGTGLGMSISRQIVIEQHGGHLYFQTSTQFGTQFFIELPISRE